MVWGAIMLNVTKFFIDMLSVNMPNVIMLSVTVLSLVTLFVLTANIRSQP
jgi:hypothetical protein